MKLVYSDDKLAAAVIEGDEIERVVEALSYCQLAYPEGFASDVSDLLTNLTAPAPNEGRPA